MDLAAARRHTERAVELRLPEGEGDRPLDQVGAPVDVVHPVESLLRVELDDAAGARNVGAMAAGLRLVADALDIKPATLFKLAGYLPRERVDNSWKAVYVADVFDRLPSVKQDMVMGVLEAIVESPEEKTRIQESRHREQNKQKLESIPTVVREAANTLIVRYGMNSPEDVENIEPETWVIGQRWDRIEPAMQGQIIALIEHKLALDYDPRMSTSDW